MTRRFKKGTLDHDGDGKKGGSRKAKKVPARKPEAAKPRDPAEQKLFDLGRRARNSGIKRGDSPYSGAEGVLWCEGWDFQDWA